MVIPLFKFRVPGSEPSCRGAVASVLPAGLWLVVVTLFFGPKWWKES